MTLTTQQAFWYPLFYITGLSSLFIFFVRWNSTRQKKESRQQSANSYFGPNVNKMIYEELCEQYSLEEPEGKKLLTMALIQRAMADIKRVFQIRNEKPSLQQLVRQGVIGEELLARMDKAEQEIERELQEVQEEAEMIRSGWGQSIFQEASQVMQAQMQREAQITTAMAQHQIGGGGVAAQVKPAQTETEEEDDDGEGVQLEPTSELTDEQRRERLAAELIEEEEKEKSKSRSKGSKGTPAKPKKK
ncbi:Pre protein translocase subunit Sec66-domain-containing protein [Polychytrium aggregatum]|uniref:Pre protein translocase subunit Sec66-domain-containing protein n=1 Tax=Polychytrium aggregatum TaxID=110093 RepID=UPI0022FF1382|nr:Pre protein translocase subunit Sec66-domain-containing protein [Polychytrium aggregatum]KAI9206881.1 Pre protein translocase subunit Sec66-domain-containing protein [Polychytrium aggregatum]